MWYPNSTVYDYVVIKDAVAICCECPVKLECLKYALNNDERIGVWGGKTPAERRRLSESNTNHQTIVLD